MSGFFFAAAAKATVTVEVPIDGQTGVWIKAGGATVSSGMSMTGATVSSGQSMYVYNRGVATSINVSGGGVVNISSGGTATSLLTYSSGTVHVSNGGSLNVFSSLEPATQNVIFNGGVATNGYILLGNLLVSSGGFAEDMTASGFSPTSRGVLNLRAGGSMNRATCQRAENGYFNGEVTDLHVSGGAAYLRSPCVASGVSVTSGTLIVSSGASALAVTSGAGAVVTVQTGGYIEYA